ncbi:hypothetical protein NLX67_20580 [Domibacillus sp. A3M-37]|uniref:hypothetical protein n=1 Tax=Domibacillus sp. A3M-37 TaxID=2962037 RepID=UPI0020B85B45|nr:hypothetical protein [Domibacillus sp. A3M-37]MCP3764733.1 hypothetical protein [Domibacillus sp. A3M-37]
MKIKELLERMQTERLADIAKNHLTIGEKPARNALKTAGCYSISGKRGWYYDGDPATLEKSIYDFTKTHGERKNESTKEPTFKLSKEQNNIPMIEQNSGSQILRKRVSFDINMALFKRLKLYCVANDKNIYEVAEAAVQEYLDRRQA